MTLQCKRCLLDLPADCFYDGYNHNGKQSYCKDCVRRRVYAYRDRKESLGLPRGATLPRPERAVDDGYLRRHEAKRQHEAELASTYLSGTQRQQPDGEGVVCFIEKDSDVVRSLLANKFLRVGDSRKNRF
jgi:hypothetical protein